MRANSPLLYNPVITETTSRKNSLYQGNTVAGPHNRGDSMMHGGQRQQDTTELHRQPIHPKNIRKIRNWNVHPLYRSGNNAQVARKMTGRSIHIMSAKDHAEQTVEKERAKAGWQSCEEVKTTAAQREKWKDSLGPYMPRGMSEDR